MPIEKVFQNRFLKDAGGKYKFLTMVLSELKSNFLDKSWSVIFNQCKIIIIRVTFRVSDCGWSWNCPCLLFWVFVFWVWLVAFFLFFVWVRLSSYCCGCRWSGCLYPLFCRFIRWDVCLWIRCSWFYFLNLYVFSFRCWSWTWSVFWTEFQWRVMIDLYNFFLCVYLVWVRIDHLIVYWRCWRVLVVYIFFFLFLFLFWLFFRTLLIIRFGLIRDRVRGCCWRCWGRWCVAAFYGVRQKLEGGFARSRLLIRAVLALFCACCLSHCRRKENGFIFR